MIVVEKLHFSVVAYVTPEKIDVWKNKPMKDFKTEVKGEWDQSSSELLKHREMLTSDMTLTSAMARQDVLFPFPPDALPEDKLDGDDLTKYRTAYHRFNCLQHVYRFVTEDMNERHVTLEEALTFCMEVSQCIVEKLKTRCSSQDALTFYKYKFRSSSAQTPPKKPRKKRKMEGSSQHPKPPKKRVQAAENAN